MGAQRKRKRRKTKAKLLAKAPRPNSKHSAMLPPNENLRKFPDEVYGDTELPFSRR